ncbi:hypothetical protein [Methylobacterium radiotolerans]|uniref:Uncharacterized protein n=1 Tax=Methylobacterium radiotolerans (strain ATCC 27329 / DSM 1819 / JCM 2831 / NBRC 15690 / NCIMB 10815 / 0-1) TaxID=426355 RepID=B1LW80_METRJ|nr:hypothetical protein [Methylobacterium radiotolerans]ACB27143.1 hypothetical protein Mrad2831_5186 [Methylobacterium radiotolerans JCM 2831]GEM98375.1 hypothetical protein MRA01_29150 [Methylobacterium radiotolerans]
MRKPNTAKAAPEATDLRQRAARARDAAGRFNRRPEPAEATVAEPDPALAVVALFKATWTAIGNALDAEVPDDLVAELQEADGAAYERLKTVRPTTPEGFQALAECWAMVLKDHRGDEPSMTVSEHAADSLIAGAGVCAPAQAVDWYNPPPGFMASPAIEPFSFARISEGIAIELGRLRGIAMAELERRIGPETSAEEIARISRELRLDVLAKAAPLDDSIVGQVEFSSATVEELSLIQEKAHLLADIANASAWQGCCAGNAAGNLMTWLGDELTVLESEAARELQRRQPATLRDREKRLAAVAERIISNNDDAETATFIQELTAWAAEQARH